MIKSFYPLSFPANLDHVVLDEPKQLAAWCRYFGVFSTTLREAVAKVGPAPAALRAYLHKPRDLQVYRGRQCTSN